MELSLPDEAATACVGAALARGLPDLSSQGLLLALSGELSSGKTTLARALLRELGVTGTIRSPTFTLIEPYETTRGSVHHLDLYRLAPGAAALEGLGYRDLRGQPGLVLVEWPERAGTALGRPDIAACLAHEGSGRQISLAAAGESGRAWLTASRALLEVCGVSC
ncbi:MAG: tRNA (adenosine(37)-N6)-threonylcarbamoyltransferase complex ATPase subunit type 1 TsaE [Gammaproteobacteria bacterium]|nr:tRNA (adenosine(37)-N6)-threonylcarbamoyltransferase complex ATPase subunit type 1 TsaE [Gammaproteobacteria bacterium]